MLIQAANHDTAYLPELGRHVADPYQLTVRATRRFDHISGVEHLERQITLYHSLGSFAPEKVRTSAGWWEFRVAS
jgi:hypothetical protein